MQPSFDTSDSYVSSLNVADLIWFRLQSKEIPTDLNL